MALKLSRIPFNRPFLVGKETEYIEQAVRSQQIAGNGEFTQKCHAFFKERYGFKEAFLTSSCTDALEMTALLANLGPGDEVIMPSYTFVSTANAFVLRGAKIVFADCATESPHIAPSEIQALINDRTRAVVVMHYGGLACDLDPIIASLQGRDIMLIEDAAHGIESFYRGQPLGRIGAVGTFSFHETKNVISGEGGLLVVNDESLIERAEILWDKGTNRAAFMRGEVPKYEWVDVGSSFLPSDILAAYLYAQLEAIETIQAQRVKLWHAYADRLRNLVEEGYFAIPVVPDYATVNGHLFYITLDSQRTRDALIETFGRHSVKAVFHYLPLHASPFYRTRHDGRVLENTDRYAQCLLRLPLFYDMQDQELLEVCDIVERFFKGT